MHENYSGVAVAEHWRVARLRQKAELTGSRAIERGDTVNYSRRLAAKLPSYKLRNADSGERACTLTAAIVFRASTVRHGVGRRDTPAGFGTKGFVLETGFAALSRARIF
jgi:hypothetical protein